MLHFQKLPLGSAVEILVGRAAVLLKLQAVTVVKGFPAFFEKMAYLWQI